MSLFRDIFRLPDGLENGVLGHVRAHRTIHAGLQDHDARLTTAESADMALGQRIDGKADTGHTHTSASITDAVSRIPNIPNRLVKTDAEGKLFILTTSITNQGDPTNKAFVEAQVKAVRDLLPSTIRVGQGVKWDGAKFIPSWLDQHTNLYDNTY